VDVLDITDSDNLLEILGDSADSITLSTAEWQEDGQVNQDGHTFNKFVDSTVSPTATLLIEDGVDVTMV
jgi:hypothetical protein